MTENAPQSIPANPRRGSASDARAASRVAETVALLALALAIALAVGNRIAFDTWIARFDVYTFFVPWYAHLGERLRAFDIPGWNPHLFSGTPFAGDPESGWMYLPAMLAFTALPVLAGFKAMAALHLAVAGATTYALGRTLGLLPLPALVAGIAYVVGPLLQWNTYCCFVLNQFATWIPLLLLGLELAFRAPRWRERALPLAGCAFAVSQMYAGWVGEGWLMAPMLAGGYALYRGVLQPVRPEAPLLRRAALAVAIAAIGVGWGMALGAAGILPRLEANAQSNLAGADYTAQGAAGMLNPPWQPAHLFAQMVGSGYDRRSAALGGAIIVLALLAPLLAGRRYGVPFFAAAGVAGTILTLPATPLHQLFYLIPRYRVLHEHDAWRVYTIVPICAAMLAGATVQALSVRRGRSRHLPLLALPLLLLLVGAIVVIPQEGFVGWPPLVAAAIATAMVMTAVAAPSGLAGIVHLVPAALAVLIFIQPTGMEITGSSLGWPADPTWERHWRPDPWVAESLANEISPTDPRYQTGDFLQARLAEDGPFRYAGYTGRGFPGDRARAGDPMGRRFEPVVQALLVNGRPMFLGLYEIQGYDPMELQRYTEFMTAVNGRSQDYHTASLLASGVGSPLLDLLDVRYLLVDAAIPPDRADIVALARGRHEVFRTPLVVIYARDAPPPHAWIVHDVRAVARGEALPLLASGTIDPGRTALVEGAAPPTAAPPTAAPADLAAESAEVIHYDPDAVVIQVRASAPGLLVVSDVFANGWRARVEGVPAEILPTDHALRGIPIPAGATLVELRYDPASLRVGLAITGAAALAVIAAFLFAARKSTRSGRRTKSGAAAREQT
ncbi:MAG: hypothetical protein IT337_03775 [Thermomicrobiales bacterium]|nr:hypothetical protein [Thermomicrobiales bacterium]